MSETPQSQQTGAAQVPPQSRGMDEERATQAPPSHRGEAPPPEVTGWAGWVVFGAMIMIMVGSFQAIVGLTALFRDDFYVVGSNNLVVSVNYTAWGWVHLALGVIAVAAGLGLLAGLMWARIVGIAMAVVSALVNLVFVAAYPLWSILVITLDVLVIYAIAMHGKEVKAG